MSEKKKSSSENISIIPFPQSIDLSDGKFLLENARTIFVDDEVKQIAEILKRVLYRATGIEFKIKSLKQYSNESNVIILKIINQNLGSEGYILEISQKKVLIGANTSNGLFYGIQTLKQLLPLQIENDTPLEIAISIPCMKIEDKPRFSWRGFMLDEARHFFGMEKVKKILDIMALLKLNVFHWHLTDDQGWRIEIKKFPQLTEIGSKRKGTVVRKRKGKQNKLDNVPVSGFYTQQEIKEIVSYAEKRYIKIVPEIDMPGHTRAVLASYPELSCTGGPFEVSTHWGVHKDVLCIGKEEVFKFAKDVLDEVIELFPAKMVHVGGDEVPTNRWKKCPDCQALMNKKKFNKEEDLQVFFTNRLAEHLNTQDRLLIGWNEILNGKLIDTAICQYWTHNFDKVLEHIKNGRKTIMSEMSCLYLNYPSKTTTIEKVYTYDPIPNQLERKHHNLILGLEACVWSEYIPNIERLEYQAFPRLAAVAEIGWTSKEQKNFNSFMQRITKFNQRLDILKINYDKGF